MGLEIDWRIVLQIVSALFGLVASVLVFLLARVFVKKEPFDALEKRVQTVEQTYVEKKVVDDLEKRLVVVETSTNKLPKLVADLNDKVIRMEATAKHFDETIKRIEHPLKLIVEAAMRAK